MIVRPVTAVRIRTHRWDAGCLPLLSMSFLSTVHDADAASDDESDDEVSEIIIDVSVPKRGRPCAN